MLMGIYEQWQQIQRASPVDSQNSITIKSTFADHLLKYNHTSMKIKVLDYKSKVKKIKI